MGVVFVIEYQANMMKERKEVKETTEKLETDLDDLAETLCTSKIKIDNKKCSVLNAYISQGKASIHVYTG